MAKGIVEKVSVRLNARAALPELTSRLFLFCTWFLIAWIAPSCRAFAQTQFESSTRNATPTARIPFTLTQSNNISIPVLLNGEDSLNLMFHTAVDSVSLTSEATERLKKKLVISESVEVQSWGGKANAKASIGNRLQIGDLEWENQTVFVDELSGRGTDGKFGPNLFEGKIIEINFDSREIVLHDAVPETATLANSAFHRMSFNLDHGSMMIDASIAIGEDTFTNPFMVHSGFSGTALLDDKFVADHELATKLETISQRELKDSFGNVLKTKTVRVPALEFGGVKFTNVPIEIFDGALGRRKVSVLGTDVLLRFNIIVDIESKHLYLEKNRSFRSNYDG